METIEVYAHAFPSSETMKACDAIIQLIALEWEMARIHPMLAYVVRAEALRIAVYKKQSNPYDATWRIRR